MAHMIKENDMIETVITEPAAWHGLDLRRDIITFDGGSLDYAISERYPQLFLNGKSSKIVPLDDEQNYQICKKYIIGQRADGPEWVIACVNNTFQTFGGSELWQMREEAMKDIPHTVASQGTLRNGKRQFICCRIESQNEKSSRYLTFLNGFDGTQALTTYSSHVLAVCQNTVNLGIKLATDLQSKKHTKNLRDFVPLMVEQIRFQFAELERFEAALINWDKRKISDKDAQSLILGITANDGDEKKISTQSINRANAVYGLFRAGKGNNGESLADVFNGFTEYHTHYSRQSKKIDPVKQKVSSEFGRDAEIKSEIAEMFMDDSILDQLASHGEKLLKAHDLILS